MIKRIAIIATCLLAVLMLAHGIVFYCRHDYLTIISTIPFLIWVVIPVISLLLIQRFKSAAYKYNGTFIVCVFLFFSLLGEGMNIYHSATHELTEGEIYYRERKRVLNAVTEWIDDNATYPESFEILYYDFSDVSSTWELPIEDVVYNGSDTAKCYKLYLEYKISTFKMERKTTERNYFWVSMKDYRVLGVTMENSYSLPVNGERINLFHWRKKYGMAGSH